MIGWRLGWRLLLRDLRSGEVRVLLAALVLAVAAVGSIGFVTDRAARALQLQANALLGGDAVLRADAAVAPEVRAQAQALGLRHSEVRSFPSMVRAGERLVLSDLRALDSGYPLRGHYSLRTTHTGDTGPADGIPARGEVWVSAAGADRLGVALGEELQVGEIALKVAALVDDEPDAVFDYFAVAPKVFFNLADLPATGLDQFGSRIDYRVVVAGDPGAVEGWIGQRKAGLARGQRLETAADARPEIRTALDRADRFLSLAALVAVMLAGVAIAVAARRHVQHHLDGCAVMRCLGAPQRTVFTVYAAELFWLGLLGSLLGVGLAYALQAVLSGWLQTTLGLQVPPAGVRPALEAVAVAAAVLAGFALPPVLALRRVPAMRVLRRDLGLGTALSWSSLLLAFGGLGGLLWWKAGSASLAAAMIGGLVATLAALSVLALALVRALRGLRRHVGGAWRYGLAGLGRRGGAGVLQVAALGLGLMLVLLLTLVRTELLARWRDTLPADAPNRFIINVQPDQVGPVLQRLRDAGVGEPVLYPMARARLLAVNNAAVTGDSYAERGERSKRLAERAFNLSWTDHLRARDNEIVAGSFWDTRPVEGVELSVEQGLAESLGWKLGDQVRFDLAGTEVEARISSLRKVDWGSFMPNFFVLVSPGALEDFPTSHITAVHVDPAGQRAIDAMVREFPNLSVIDVDAVLGQIRRISDQVSLAVEYVFVFTLIAGLLVLIAAVTATQDERLLEGGVMRAFGAGRRQLRTVHLAEFSAIGLLAGVTAAIAASVISAVVAKTAFDLEWQADWRLAAAGAGLGVVLVTVTGLLATRRVVAAPPAVVLRALQS